MRGKDRREIERLQAKVDDLREQARANDALLAYARREELTHGALRRALREAIEIERRIRDGELLLDDDWEAFMEDPEYGFLVYDLAWEFVMRAIANERPPTLEEAEGLLRSTIDEVGVERRDADALAEALRDSWPDKIADECERVGWSPHEVGNRADMEEEYLLALQRRGATSPRAVLDLEREIAYRWPPPPIGSGPPPSLEQIAEWTHTRAEQLGLAPGDLKVLDDWVGKNGPAIIATWGPPSPI